MAGAAADDEPGVDEDLLDSSIVGLLLELLFELVVVAISVGVEKDA